MDATLPPCPNRRNEQDVTSGDGVARRVARLSRPRVARRLGARYPAALARRLASQLTTRSPHSAPSSSARARRPVNAWLVSLRRWLRHRRRSGPMPCWCGRSRGPSAGAAPAHRRPFTRCRRARCRPRARGRRDCRPARRRSLSARGGRDVRASRVGAPAAGPATDGDRRGRWPATGSDARSLTCASSSGVPSSDSSAHAAGAGTSRRVILAGDAFYVSEKMRARLLPAGSLVSNPDQMVASWEKIEWLERELDATLIPTHDLQFRQRIRLAPVDSYE
jgi:hypothetical protein